MSTTAMLIMFWVIPIPINLLLWRQELQYRLNRYSFLEASDALAMLTCSFLPGINFTGMFIMAFKIFKRIIEPHYVRRNIEVILIKLFKLKRGE